MSNWPKERRKDLVIKMFLFITSPVASCLYSLKRVNTRSSYLIFFLTSILFGLAFTVPNIRLKSGIDGITYRIIFESYVYVTDYIYKQELLEYLSLNSSFKDFYVNTVAFYVTRFTDNYHVMFMIFAMVFSYFMLKSLRFLTNSNNFKYSIVSYILVYLFTYNQIFNINGVRFWTAAWIATYCILQIIYNGNKKYYALALLTPFFHGAYFLFIAILIIYSLTKRSERLWIFLFLFSFVFSSFASTVLVSFVQFFESSLPPFIVRMVQAYTNVEYIEKLSSDTNLLYSVAEFGVRLYMFIMMYLLIKNAKLIRLNTSTYNLYMFTLMWVSIFSFLLTVPSLGVRFITISYPLIALVWLNTFGSQKYKYYILLLPLVFILNIYGQYIYYTLVLDKTFYFSPFFLIVYEYLVAY